MSYAAASALARHDPLRDRVKAAAFHVARDIASEGAPSPGDVMEAGQPVDASLVAYARLRLALDVIAHPDAALDTFVWIAAHNGQVQSGLTVHDDGTVTVDDSDGKADDAALYYVVSDAWNKVGRYRARGTT